MHLIRPSEQKDGIKFRIDSAGLNIYKISYHSLRGTGQKALSRFVYDAVKSHLAKPVKLCYDIMWFRLHPYRIQAYVLKAGYDRTE